MNIKKSGFTMIELAVVIVIIGILYGVSVLKLKISEPESNFILYTMKNDVKKIISTQSQLYLNTNEFGEVTYQNNSGEAEIAFLETPSGDKKQISISPHNEVEVKLITCNDGAEGYTITISNPKTKQNAYYDSCSDASVKLVSK